MSQSRKSSKFEGAAVDKVDETLGNRLQDAVQNSENEFFNKHYNKELRVSKDEIPIVLAELNESAHAFIKKEQYERALNLLQKAYGIMDAIDFQSCRRDMYHLFIMFHNMALCYQKLQMLEECAQCIEHAFDHLPLTLINLEEKSISYRMRKIFIIGKLKLQYCAILSQIHRHKDALEQAREGVKVCHQMVNDMYQLCQFYVKREKLNNAYVDMTRLQSNNDSQNNSNQQALDDYSSRFDNKRSFGSQSRNRSFSSFLSQQEAYAGFESFSLNNVRNQSFIGGNTGSNKSLGGRQASVGQGNLGNLTRGSANQSMHSLSSFCTVNELEKSISYVEKTAKKLLPILIEVKKRMIPDKKQGGIKKSGANKKMGADSGSEQDDDEDLIVDLSKVKGNQKVRDKRNGPVFDMKNILGYLNQGENLQTLSIGNIMQLQAFRLKDMIEEGKNELELTRESFILKISHLAVSYFCYSTEIRFILQMKEDPSFDTVEKQKESEYWHAKSLQIACSFLPGECPLLNHINMSFQKHFAPVKTEIKEDEEASDKLRVVKPLHGIENQKFQPMIKNLDDVDISITPYQMTPLNAVTRPFINQLKSFNSYTEKSQNNSFAINPNNSQHQSNKANPGAPLGSGKGRHQRTANDKGSTNQETIMEDMCDDALAESSQEVAPGNQNKSQFENDIQLLEKLFKKVQLNYNVDKVKLFKKLIDSNTAGKLDSKQQSETPSRTSKNILQVRNSNKTGGGAGVSTSKHEDISIDHQVDFLMDENILSNESREEDDNGQVIRTPNNIKNLNVKGINQINPATFNNQTGMKKTKGSSGKALSSSKSGQPNSTQAQTSIKGALGHQNLVTNSDTSAQGSSNLHQRPKTQINGQRNSSNRETRTQQSTFGGHNGSITSIEPASSGKSGSNLQQKSTTSQQNIIGTNHQRYQQHDRNTGNQPQTQKFAQHHQVVDAKAKRSSQRPFSGGIQKIIRTENHKSRVQNFNQKNFSMYDQKMANMSGSNPVNQSSASQLDSSTQNSKFLNPGLSSHHQSHSPSIVNSSAGRQGVNGQGSQGRYEGDHHQLYYNRNQQHNSSQQQLGKHQQQNFSQGSQSIGQSNSTSQPNSAELSANPMNQQKQLQALQKQHQQMAAAMTASGNVQGSNPNAQGQSGSSGGASNVHVKNQLQGAATNILAGNPGGQQEQSQEQYEDLKKKLLHEYKKMQKKGGGALSQNQLQQLKQAQQSTGQSSQNAQLQQFLNQKSQQQIEQTLQNSAKALSQSQQHINDGNQTQTSSQMNANNNLNNSTTSAHLNVYKPTFIINNSYQPGGANGQNTASANNQASGSVPEAERNHSRNTDHLNTLTSSFNNAQSTGGQINNPQNLAISAAGPSGGSIRDRNNSQNTQQHISNSQQMQMSSHNMHGSFGKKQSAQMRGMMTTSGQHLQIQSHSGHNKASKNTTTSITPSQQQILLMNVLISQGMDKAQAQAQMQQMQSTGSKPHKDGSSRSGNISSLQQHGNIKKSNRYQSSSNARGITPTQESKQPHLVTQHHNIQSQQQLQGGSSALGLPYASQSRNTGLNDGSNSHHSRSLNPATTSGQAVKTTSSTSQSMAQYHHALSQAQLSKVTQGGFSQGGVPGSLSAANLPHSSNIVTGGKISAGPSGSRGFHSGQGASGGNITMPSRKK